MGMCAEMFWSGPDLRVEGLEIQALLKRIHECASSKNA